MKISAVQNTNIYYKKQTLNKKSISVAEKSVTSLQHYYRPSFFALPLDKLYAEYNWYINCDHVPAVNSFLKMEAPKEIMNGFLLEILKTKDRGYEFIDSIVTQPRNINAIKESLIQKLGKESPLLQIYAFNSDYNKAYTNYIETKYNDSRNIIELLKIRPDWKGDALFEKHKELFGNDNFTIGKVPKQISKNHLYQIIDYLKDKMEIGIKTNKTIDNLVIDGKTYEFKFFTEGKSSKNVFGLFVPSEGKKYVIKMDNPESRSLDAPFALGTLAKIDGYLTSNRSRNSAPLCYYDHKNNFSVYKYIEHTPICDETNNMSLIRSKLPDFKALGLDYNDTVGFKNFFLLNENSLDTYWKMEGFDNAIGKCEWISVDNDHVTYSSPLQPMVYKYHSSLPNACKCSFKGN